MRLIQTAASWRTSSDLQQDQIEVLRFFIYLQ